MLNLLASYLTKLVVQSFCGHEYRYIESNTLQKIKSSSIIYPFFLYIDQKLFLLFDFSFLSYRFFSSSSTLFVVVVVTIMRNWLHYLKFIVNETFTVSQICTFCRKKYFCFFFTHLLLRMCCAVMVTQNTVEKREK